MMAMRQILIPNHNPTTPKIISSSHGNPSKPKHPNHQNHHFLLLLQPKMKRRLLLSTMASLVLMKQEEENGSMRAYGLDLRMVAPEQSLEEAQTGVEDHAKALLNVKDLIESKSWREAQKELRKSSSLLKQDIYTIIQGKPGNQRPQLRKLYSLLFNSVTKLDYAARAEDASLVSECYHNIVSALDDILSKL